MNDTVSSSPTASPPSSEPSTPPSGPEAQTPPETLAKLAAGDSIDEYVEQRKEDAGEINPNATPSERNFNRHQRARAKIERLKAELNATKAQNSVPRDNDGTPTSVERWQDEFLRPEQTAALDAAREAAQAAEIAAEFGDQPTDAEQQQPQQPQETREQYEERIIEEIRQTDQRREHAAEFRARERMIARTAFPDYDQVIAQAPSHEIPQALHDQITASPVGWILKYGLSHPAGQSDFVALLHASPREQERTIMKWEAMIEANMQLQQQRAAPQPQQQQRRVVTRAKPPITPLRGSAAPHRSTADLSENMTAYAEARLREMKNKQR